MISKHQIINLIKTKVYTILKKYLNSQIKCMILNYINDF